MNSPSLLQFLEVTESAVDRATFYNSLTQQEESVDNLHDSMMSHDRELYILTQGFSSLNYYNRLAICRNVLFNNGYLALEGGERKYARFSKTTGARLFGGTSREVDWRELENEVILRTWASVPVTTLLRELVKWRKRHLNNMRSRNLILRFIFGADNFCHWAMVYRKLLRSVLSHVWGEAQTLRIKKDASHYLRLGSVSDLLKSKVQKYLVKNTLKDVCEGLSVIMGDFNVPFTRPEYVQRQEARGDASKIAGLPVDVALGLGSMHKDFDKSTVYGSKKAQEKMSAKQKVRVQRAAEKTGAAVEMDLATQNTSTIIRYGYERGFDKDVTSAIAKRIKSEAKKSPMRFGKAAVVVDSSASMFGSGQRKYFPIASGLSVALFVKEISDSCEIIYTSETTAKFPRPSGDTDLAGAVVKAFMTKPEIVFLVSDNYENVSAGTLDSVIRAIRKVGIKTPLVNLNPVFASESTGVRKVSDLCFTSSVTGSESLPAMYEKLLIASGDDPRMVMKLKKYLLDRLNLKRIPASIKEEFAQVEAAEGSMGLFQEKLLSAADAV